MSSPLNETRWTWLISVFEVCLIIRLRFEGFLDSSQTFTSSSIKSRGNGIERKVETSKILEILEFRRDESDLVLANIDDSQPSAKRKLSGQLTDLVSVGLKLVKKSQATNLSRKGGELVVADVKLGEGHDKTDLRRDLSQLVAAEIEDVKGGETTETTRKTCDTVGGQVELTEATHLADFSREFTDLVVEKVQSNDVGESTDGRRKSNDLVAAEVDLGHGCRDLVDVLDLLDANAAEIHASCTTLLYLL